MHALQEYDPSYQTPAMPEPGPSMNPNDDPPYFVWPEWFSYPRFFDEFRRLGSAPKQLFYVAMIPKVLKDVQTPPDGVCSPFSSSFSIYPGKEPQFHRHWTDDNVSDIFVPLAPSDVDAHVNGRLAPDAWVAPVCVRSRSRPHYALRCPREFILGGYYHYDECDLDDGRGSVCKDYRCITTLKGIRLWVPVLRNHQLVTVRQQRNCVDVFAHADEEQQDTPVVQFLLPVSNRPL
jgi:hypothetical protein